MTGYHDAMKADMLQTCCYSVSLALQHNCPKKKASKPKDLEVHDDQIQVCPFSRIKQKQISTSKSSYLGFLHLIPFISGLLKKGTSYLKRNSKNRRRTRASERKSWTSGERKQSPPPHLLQPHQSSKTNYTTLHWDMLIPNQMQVIKRAQVQYFASTNWKCRLSEQIPKPIQGENKNTQHA